MGRTPFPSPAPESEIHIKVQPRKSVDQSSYLQYQPVSGAGASPSPSRPPAYRNSPNQPPPPPYNPSSSSKRWIPWLVPTIVVVNIILFVIAMSLNNCPQNSGNCLGAKELGRFAFENMHQNPLLGPSPSTLLNMGGMDVKKVVQRHEVWRLITCMWLHAGLFHVLANMLSLLFVGIRLEQEFGFLRIGLLYVISGIGGSLVSSLFIRTTISVGASGALFGLLGAMLSELLINWTIYENKVASLLSLIVIILINMAVGILPHVDNFAHLGGFGTGFLLGCVLMIRPQFGYVSKRNVPPGCSPPRKSKYKTYQCSLFVVSILLLVAGFAVGLALLLKGVDGNEHCSWCHYLSCVPTPLWSCQARCTSSQSDNQLFLTCTSNNKSQFYTLDSGGNSTSQLQTLCSELCR